jgi:tape measure domain-containing protein
VAVANIAIEVNGQQAANALKQITTASRQLESAVGSTTTKINNQNSATSSASNQLRNYSKSTQVATAATNGLRGAVTNLLGAFTAISAAKFVFAKTAELQAQTKSLEVLTGSASKANQIIKELQQLGAVTPFTSTELIDSAKRLNAFGVEGDKVVGTTRRLADVAGATGAELQGLVTAYGQVQAKGRLQGEELLQFQERGVALQEELRKMYGLSGEEFQKALSKGRISAEAVEVAIQRLTDAGGKYANGAVAQSGTLQGKFSTLQDSVDELARVIGQKLAPALSSFIDNTTAVVKAITDLPDPVKNATGELIKFGIQFLVVKKAIEAVIAIRAAYIGALAAITVATAASGTAATGSATAFALYTTNVRTLQAASIATAGSVSGLSAALLGLAGIGIVTVGINYVITQTGAVLASADAAQKSLAARSQQSLAGQLKGKTVEERQKMLKITQKNLANDRKLASTLALQVRAQDARAQSAAEMAAPADRAKLIEVQARVKTNQARIKAITSIPLEKPKKPELPPTPALLGETGGGKTGSGAANKAANDAARLAEQTKTQLDAAYKLNALAAADLDIQMSMTKEETLQGQFDKAALERKFKYADLQKNFKSEQERQLIASAQESEILIANNKYAKDKKDILEQQTTELYSQLDISGVLDKTLQKRLSGAFMGKSATTGFRTDINLDPSKKAGKIQEYVDKAKTDLADVQGMVVSLATTVESSIGSAMSNAISGVIQGTTTVREAFSSMFKSIGDAFIQMATQMIAKALIMKVLGILGGAIGGGGGSKTTDFSSVFGKGGMTTNFGDALKLPAFADGGYVTGPTSALIGEGGQSEYVIPASKMMQAMSNYSAGKRGSSVLGDSTSMGDGGMGGSTGSFTLETVVINNVEYATVDQVRAMSSAAAKQGAEGGFSKSMSSLRNSRSQRSRLGMR